MESTILQSIPSALATGDILLELSYLVAALLFVFGLKKLSHPETARNGNLWAAAGMLLAMVTTALLHKNADGETIKLTNLLVIVLAILVGAVVGWIMSHRVKMTAMPQLVSLFNATGGAASALVGLLEYPNAVAGNYGSIAVTVLGLVIGAVAFSGSIIAYGKLDGKVKDLRLSALTYINLLMLVAVVVVSVLLVVSTQQPSDMIWANLGIVCNRIGVWRIVRYAYWRSRYACCNIIIKRFNRDSCYHGGFYLPKSSYDIRRNFCGCCGYDSYLTDV